MVKGKCLEDDTAQSCVCIIVGRERNVNSLISELEKRSRRRRENQHGRRKQEEGVRNKMSSEEKRGKSVRMDHTGELKRKDMKKK